MDKRIIKVFSLVGLITFAGSSCVERRHEGPLERMGREVDDSIDDATHREKTPREKVGESIRDLGDRIEDSE